VNRTNTTAGTVSPPSAASLVDGTENLRLRKLPPPARERAEALIAGAREAREARAVRRTANA